MLASSKFALITLLSLTVALACTSGEVVSSKPQGDAVDQPASESDGGREAFQARLDASRDNEFLARTRDAYPPHLVQLHEESWVAGLEKMDKGDKAEFDNLLAMLTAEDAEGSLFEMLSPMREAVRGQGLNLLDMTVRTNRSGDPFYALGGHEQLVMIQELRSWLKRVDLSSDDMLRAAIGIACEAVRGTGIKGHDDVATLGYARQLELRGDLWAAGTEIVKLYGFDLGASLDTVSIVDVEASAGEATITFDYELLGEQREGSVDLEQHASGQWYAKYVLSDRLTSDVVEANALPVCSSLHVSVSDMREQRDQPSAVDVSAGGVISIDGEALWRAQSPDQVEQLNQGLARLAAEMPTGSSDQLPSGRLLLRAHREAPYSVVLDLLEVCRSSSIGVWKYELAARGRVASDRGSLTFFGRVGSGRSGVDKPNEVELVVSAGSSGPAYSLRIDDETSDSSLRELGERVEGASSRAEFIEVLRQERPGIYSYRICPEGDTSWGAVVELLGDLGGDRPQYGGAQFSNRLLKWDAGFVVTSG